MFVIILRVDCRLFQVGFMNDGKIVAADIQFFANSGNTADESPLVSGKKEMLLEINLSETTKNVRVDFVVFAGCWEDGPPHGHCVQHPQSARSRHCMQDQPAIKHGLQGLRGAPGPADRGEHDQWCRHGVGMSRRQGSAPSSPATSLTSGLQTAFN